MTKPWEEEWTYDGKFGGLVTKGESVILESSVSDCLDGSYERARLASAAPDMARCLLDLANWANLVLMNDESGDPDPVKARNVDKDRVAAAFRALKKAGVTG